MWDSQNPCNATRPWQSTPMPVVRFRSELFFLSFSLPITNIRGYVFARRLQHHERKRQIFEFAPESWRESSTEYFKMQGVPFLHTVRIRDLWSFQFFGLIQAPLFWDSNPLPFRLCFCFSWISNCELQNEIFDDFVNTSEILARPNISDARDHFVNSLVTDSNYWSLVKRCPQSYLEDLVLF